jgi:alkaline phosphatase D
MSGNLVAAQAPGFQSNWPQAIERPWVGPEYWSNPLQDWRVREGRVECFVAGKDRNVFLLTREVDARRGNLAISVRLGRLDSEALKDGFVGFRVGIKGYFHDYRDSALRGLGLEAGLAADGRLFIGTLDASNPKVAPPAFDSVELQVNAEPTGSSYKVVLQALDNSGRKLAEIFRPGIKPEWLTGGVALVCSSGPIDETPLPAEKAAQIGISGKNAPRGGTMRFWFRDWKVSGSKVTVHDERAFGPILFAMHTLSRKVMKLTAQLAPVGNAPQRVSLQVRSAPSAAWRTVARAVMDPMACTATFRIPHWDDGRDTPYRVVYSMPGPEGRPREYHFGGTIRRNPAQKPDIVVAAFTGNNDWGFPHADVVKHVSWFKPDLLVYTGDQIYERVGDYGFQRSPVETARLDYLRKWYIFGWEYRELLKDIPAVCLPDDHDVYQGNIWGAGGRHAQAVDEGGYTMPTEWVNMIQRLATSHMPDPYDPTPVQQGISVYYCPLVLGGVSFAVVEDRKWKSSPQMMLPKAQIVNGWAQNPSYNPARDGDAPGAELLGARQIDFLNHWAADWDDGIWMKALISQTLFADVTTVPKGTKDDNVVPELAIPRPGEYPDNDVPAADHDTDGWPQSGRNEAVRTMRRALAFHIAGDQHLGTTVQYGLDEFDDAGWALCVPAVSNIFPRRWWPAEAGRNRLPGSPKYTGEFFDGFGNRVTVRAVANPTVTGLEPALLTNRATGYGIVTLHRATRKITMACWPRWVDPSKPGAKPYDGWPITVDQVDNGLTSAGWVLDRIHSATADPVVQVIDESSGEIVYTIRIRGTVFVPKVFKGGTYTVKVNGIPHAGRKARRP